MDRYEVITRRVGGKIILVHHITQDAFEALTYQRELARELMDEGGFSGYLNRAAVYHLTKRTGGKRIRIAVEVRTIRAEHRFSVN